MSETKTEAKSEPPKTIDDYKKNEVATGQQISNYKSTVSTMTYVIVVLSWAVFGLISFIVSLWCFKRSGSTFERVFGAFIALFLGPLFWIYYAVNKSYCRA